MNYFQTLQSQTLDKNDGGIVYRGLATLAPQHIDTAQVNLTNMDKIHVDLLNLKHDRAHEIRYVQDMIHHLDHPDDSLVVTASYQYLTQLLIGSDLHFFSKKSKLLFKEHLDRKSLINHHQSMLYASAYLEFKAALNAKKPDDIPLLTKSYIQDLDPDLQEPAFNGLMGITKDTKNRLKFNHQK
ncbi:MAG: hypothetical protein CK424_03275 [Legionella sp.]|nr:MAG: hypothetical protein CK424_03275 [Legionella sp.]